MRVMLGITDPVERGHTMTKGQSKGEVIDIKGLLERDADFLRSAVRAAIEAALEAEMTEALAPKRANAPRAGWATAAATTSAR
jgi:hypothetical protein